MKKALKNIMLGRYSSILFFIISALAVLFNYAYRFGYVFVDAAVFTYFSLSLFLLAALNTAALLVISVMQLKALAVCSNKKFAALQCAAELFALFFVIVDIINFATGGSENAALVCRMCREILPGWLAVVGIAAAVFIYPNIRGKKLRKAISVLTAAALVFTVYSFLFPVTPFRFTSGPVVFDNGTDYAVAFSTNDAATAYIEYEYRGESIRKYDADNGRKNGSGIIHTIHIPYEQLSGNSYKVGATRVIDELSYGGRLGKTIESDYIAFKDDINEKAELLTVSDWHTHTKKAAEAVKYLGSYNAVILLGDAAPGMMFVEEAAEYILAFGSDLSGGAMPVLFARGNHETRGRAADDLPEYLGIECFYYKARLGNYDIIVLDSGEDKEDTHPEYGGMVTYEQNRREMVEWLNGIENEDGRKTIALSHSEEICIEKDLSEQAHHKLDTLHVSLLASGHWHTTEFKNNGSYPVLIDGGINANGAGTYVASKLVLTPENIEVVSMDSNGETTVNEVLEWR